ncbi:poly-gamma-glutamate hydrolase family protein [Methylibium petroleiphilum]|uniref:poly-gamma-glutamate hydrolase family protein n=1 Tax=Methylibium petroleiphilum TaxID=105560 RepID=UPI001ACC9E79|nr:poly-gamma-glutamate hydrolase family protein [Methylibium petroleiphilum]MBN9206176.1 poly-gamma-glutamate hydrolase family protein [Methylibium petroleiphilum]
MVNKLAQHFRSFADLASAYEQDRDYRIVQVRKPGSGVAILAPHGGSIEAHTSDIAREIAGQDFNLYLFEGLLKAGNFAALHLGSHRFDEPGCLELLQGCKSVVSVHGCGHAGEIVLTGGRDAGLREAITERLKALGVACEAAPAGLDAVDPMNVCNRGEGGAGVQLEVSLELRRSPRRVLLVRAVRETLTATP